MEERGITPQLQLPEHSVYMETDKVVIERIFQNLITNAISYVTRIGGEVEARINDGELVIELMLEADET